jgi:hypothetical protein
VAQYNVANSDNVGVTTIDFLTQAVLNGTVGANYTLTHVDGTLTVTAGAAPAIGSPELPSVVVGADYNIDVATALGITGTPAPTITVTGLPDGLTYSNGVISGAPAAAGSYQVTVTVTNSGGTESKTITLVVGAAVHPGNPKQVVIPSIPHVTTDPGVGTYYASSGDEFTVTLTPDEGYRLSYAKVNTGDDSFDATIKYTLNDDGTLTVVIPNISGNIRLDLTGVSPVGIDEVGGTEVWASDGVLHVVCRDAASHVSTVQIYTTTGILYKTVIAPAGETTVDLPAGVYVVRVGDLVVKVVI